VSPNNVHLKREKRKKRKEGKNESPWNEFNNKRIYGPLRMKEIVIKGNDKKIGCQDQN
jgi:hypothetical protein